MGLMLAVPGLVVVFIYVKQDTMVNLISRMEAALEDPASNNSHVA